MANAEKNVHVTPTCRHVWPVKDKVVDQIWDGIIVGKDPVVGFGKLIKEPI